MPASCCCCSPSASSCGSRRLLRHEVWGSALVHLLVTGVVGAALIYWTAHQSLGVAVIMALSLGFSSTVLAAKVLEGNRELRSVHGRVAIGILIVQDIVAVVLLAFVSIESPSPYALVLLLLPLARPADRPAARLLRPRRAARAVRRRACARRRRAVHAIRAERGARCAAARHDARRSPARPGADQRAVGPQGAVPRRVLSEHRLERRADVGLAADGASGCSCSCRCKACCSSCC